MAWFKKQKYTTIKAPARHGDVPEGAWKKCEECGEILHRREWEKNLKVCSKCGYHFVLGARERIEMLVDEGTFEEYDSEMVSVDPLTFPNYVEKLHKGNALSGLIDAIVSGKAKIGGMDAVLFVTDSSFMMGSMGSVLGEKVTNAMERAIAEKTPLVSVTGSGGGARMQEGMFSLMQMAKTSAAVGKLHDTGILYVSVLTNPTMGGVLASFASLGDIIIAEPKALLGFAGPRVIEQTIRQTLPEGFQRTEFMLEHGFVDAIVQRKELKPTIEKVMGLLK